MTEDDDTPPIRLPTDDERVEHFFDYPPGTPPVHMERTMNETGASDALERIARILEQLAGQQQQSVASLVASRDATRKVMWPVILALLGALGTVLVFSAEKIASSSERAGRMEATIEALKDARQQDREEISQLRGALLRLTGTDKKTLSIVRNP